MTKNTQIPTWIIEDISDPFDVFPLAHALRDLGRLIEKNEHELYSQYEDVAPKYRDIGLEQGLEAVSIIMGAGFVAAQSILTRTYSNVRRLAELDVVQSAGDANMPKSKNELYRINAHDRDGVPDIIGINALANFFKHSSEWPIDWSKITKRSEIETAKTVIAMGLLPGYEPQNMTRGAASLMFGGRDGLSKLATGVQEWRESVEIEIRKRLSQANLLSQ
jgi:hypothetical protein